MTSRRRFIQLGAIAGIACACRPAASQEVPADPVAPAAPAVPVAPTPAAGPLMSESEPQAIADGYVNDARRADRLRFPKYRPGQHCGNCQNYRGPSNAPKAPCAHFSGREVQGPGWCSSHLLRVG